VAFFLVAFWFPKELRADTHGGAVVMPGV